MTRKQYLWLGCLVWLGSCKPKEPTPAQIVSGQYTIVALISTDAGQIVGPPRVGEPTSILRVREQENSTIQLSLFLYYYNQNTIDYSREVNGVAVRPTPEPKQLAFGTDLGEPLYDLYWPDANSMIGQVVDRSKEKTDFKGKVIYLRIPQDRRGDRLSINARKRE